MMPQPMMVSSRPCASGFGDKAGFVNGQVLICGPPSGSFSSRWQVLDDITARTMQEPEAAAMLVRQLLDSRVVTPLSLVATASPTC